ncbi:MAG: autotransporter-associated beta strand repeat-containing protein [Verrucomicrobia bacterium]|nr:autotransporter-associated beta strand repeat-containing protein [Verrucomicrobiota bacterium]
MNQPRKNSTFNRRQQYLRAIATVAALITGVQGRAASFTWDAGGDGFLYNDGANWSTDTVPSNSAATELVLGDGAGGVTGEQLIFMETARLVGKIRFAADSDATYSLEDLGGRISISAGSFGGVGIRNDASALRSINVAITIPGSGVSQTWDAASGDLGINGTVNLNSNTVTVDGANNTTVGGVVSGAGGLAKTGAGSLSLSGANTFAGGLAISGGTAILGADAAPGSGSITLSGGTLQASGNRTISNPVSIGGGGGTVGGSAQLTLSGLISGGALTKSGSGVLTIGGDNNTFSTLNVNGGTTVLDSSAGNALADSAAVNFNGGTLDVRQNETAGVLTLASGSSTLALELGAGRTLTFSSLVLAGGTLAVTGHGGGFGVASTDNKLFVTADLGSGFIDEVSFTGVGSRAIQLDSGELVPVPEPTAIASAFGLLGFALWRFRAKRNQAAA